MTAVTANKPASAWPLLAVTLALLAALALAFWLVGPLHDVATAALDGDGALVRSRTHALGAAGALVLLALVLAHAVIPYPAELTTAAAGYVYGFGPGAALMMVSWFLTALLAYELARAVGRPVARRLIGQRRLAKAESFVARGGPAALIAARFVPLIPFNAVCYAAGITGVARTRYAWTTIVGIAPFCFVVAYLGSRLQTVGLSDYRLWLAVAALLAILFACHRFLSPSGDDPRRGGRVSGRG
ncbi:MAG: hypothetical protein QOJ35_3325 [Solirubrobacteraceae bacterium]|jgi:uncharacterized membrane protein YdjX (TVP38/TMEM64 family)|nr:hypothetical protein [Solirubrobacteraceae bacterium]